MESAVELAFTGAVLPTQDSLPGGPVLSTLPMEKLVALIKSVAIKTSL